MSVKVTIDDAVPERGVCYPTINFLDETGTPVVPTTATWSLTDSVGTVINGRSSVSLTPASAVTFTLSGLDRAVGTGLVGVTRKLLIEGTYTSAIGGAGMPLKGEVTFTIADFVKPTGIT